jgi:hypothetical protein
LGVIGVVCAGVLVGYGDLRRAESGEEERSSGKVGLLYFIASGPFTDSDALMTDLSCIIKARDRLKSAEPEGRISLTNMLFQRLYDTATIDGTFIAETKT